MTNRSRDATVGLFVLMAVVMLVMLSVWFGRNPFMLGSDGYRIQLWFPSSAGIGPDASIFMNGERIGEIVSVRLENPDRPQDGVIMIGRIDLRYSIPAYAEPTINTPLFPGRSTIGFEVTRQMHEFWMTSDPSRAAMLPKSGTMGTLRGRVSSGLLDEGPVLVAQVKQALQDAPVLVANLNKASIEVAELARVYTEVGRNVEALTSALNPADVEAARGEDGIQTRLANLAALVSRLYDLAHHLNQIAGDAGTVEDIRQTLANARKASADAVHAVEELRAEVKRLSDRADAATVTFEDELRKVSSAVVTTLIGVDRTTDALRETLALVNTGQGTVGLLLRDNRLYEAIVITAQQLNAALLDAQALLQQIGREGVKLKL